MGELVPASKRANAAAPLWKPGQSGNPKGRPRSEHDLPALCRQHTKEAIERLVQIMRAEDDGRALMAVQQLLDRGWGKPITPIVDETPANSMSMLHLIAARRVAEALEAMAAGQTSNDSGEAKPTVIDYSVPALE